MLTGASERGLSLVITAIRETTSYFTHLGPFTAVTIAPTEQHPKPTTAIGLARADNALARASGVWA